MDRQLINGLKNANETVIRSRHDTGDIASRIWATELQNGQEMDFLIYSKQRNAAPSKLRRRKLIVYLINT